MKLYQELLRAEREVFAKCESEYSRELKIMPPAEKKKKFAYESERNQVFGIRCYEFRLKLLDIWGVLLKILINICLFLFQSFN
jgi:hypothetical protein